VEEIPPETENGNCNPYVDKDVYKHRALLSGRTTRLICCWPYRAGGRPSCRDAFRSRPELPSSASADRADEKGSGEFETAPMRRFRHLLTCSVGQVPGAASRSAVRLLTRGWRAAGSR
jgi:hypothetical protein